MVKRAAEVSESRPRSWRESTKSMLAAQLIWTFPRRLRIELCRDISFFDVDRNDRAGAPVPPRKRAPMRSPAPCPALAGTG